MPNLHKHIVRGKALKSDSHLVAGGNHAVGQTERQGFFCSKPIVAVDSDFDFLIGFAGGLTVDINDEIPGFEDFIGLDFKIRGPALDSWLKRVRRPHLEG